MSEHDRQKMEASVSLAREDNPRLVSRQTWWIEYGRWMTGKLPWPICTECADPIPDAPFTGAFVCAECSPYVPESERALDTGGLGSPPNPVSDGRVGSS